MAYQGEAASGYRVYQQNQKKKTPTPVKSGVLKGIGYGNEVQQGYKNLDQTYADNAEGDRQTAAFLRAMGLSPQGGAQASYGSGGGGGGGGGSYAAAAPKPTFDATPYQFNGAPYDTLLQAMQKGYGTDQASAGNAYNELDRYLSQLQDPYAHIQPAQAAQVDPSQLANLIRSQGGGDAGLLAQAQFLQAQNGQSAAASNRLAQLLSANQQSWNQGTQATAKTARTQSQDELLAQFNALKAQIEAQKLSQQQQLDRERMLAQAAFNERNA